MGEDLYELPKGWVWTGLKIVCEKIQDGSHFSPQVQYPESGEGRYLYITAKNIKANGLDLSDVTYVDYTFHKSIYERCNPEKGDVLLTKDGVKTGVVTLNTLDEEFSLLSSVALFKTNKIILYSNYLRYFLSSPVGLKMITGQMTGTAIKRIVLDKIRQSYICLPPLPEQYRIVAKIEELFTLLDAGVELLKKVKAKLKRYRQAVLKAAVEGNLTKEWREANQGKLEPASVLLERILQQRREKWEAEQLAKMKAQGKTPKDDSWKLKYKEAIAPNTSDLPELPDGWCWATIEQLLIKIQYGSSSKTNDDSSGVAVLRMGNILAGKIVINELKYLPKHHNEFPELLLEYGDLLFNRTNSFELVGKTAVYQGIPNPSSCASYLIRVRLNQNVQPYFISHYINSVFGRQWIKSVVSQQVGQANVNGTKLQALQVPFPPKEEQLIIKEEVERLFSVTDQLEKTINANLKRAEKLRQTILKQAFEGKLVPQDPNDEPAEKLLERIKAEKAKQVTTKTKKKTKSQPQSPAQLALPLE